MPNKTQLTTAATIVALLIAYRYVAPRLGLPVV